MINFVKKNNRNHLILFIHGFTGNSSTWKNGGQTSFGELLGNQQAISDKFDIAEFEYFTRLTNAYAKAMNTWKRFKSLFPVSQGKLAKNISVDEISELLRTEIRFNLQQYDNIIIIAHSMGGLVAKSCIVKDIENSVPSKISMFISLAVPHLGAELATFGKLVSSNVQIEGLSPLNEYLQKINGIWLKASQRPETKYFFGTYDSIVAKTSAVPADKELQDAISVAETHSSICKPEDEETTVFKAVLNLILEGPGAGGNNNLLPIQTLPSDDEFKDELFVLKLIVADIHSTSVKDAKEMFLNAEFMRKKFDSDDDRNRFLELYAKVRKIYKDLYSEFIHGGIANSGVLLSQVHQKILAEDREFLNSAFLPALHAMHKQGMLHQLANSDEQDIWWSKDTGLKFLRAALEGGASD
ncbi:MAG: ABC-three component system protein [Flavobacteriaceae bacterium]